MNRTEEIIRGDDQTLPIPVTPALGDLTGATVHMFIVPKTASVSDTVVDPAAVSRSTLGPLPADTTSLDFEFSSTPGATNTSVLPLATYGWYGRIVRANGKVTTFRFNPLLVEVTAPKGDY